MGTVLRWTGVEVRALRDALRMTVRDFAAYAGLSVSALAEMEARREDAKPRNATQRIMDTVLDRADDQARTRFESLLAAEQHRRSLIPQQASPAPRPRVPDRQPTGTVSLALHMTHGGLSHPQPDGHVLTLIAPAGRSFAGASIDAQAYPASDNGHVLATVPTTRPDDPFLRRPRRCLLIGVIEHEQGPELFGLDNRRARRHLAAAAEGAHVPIPKAYQLDDLTTGLLWAVANVDDALLSDDALLATCHPWVAGYEALHQSTASRDAAEGLSAVSQMWLGSDFCARHILRHCGELAELPMFWTREQHGEEASNWLLFTHKYDYLRRLARYGNHSGQPSRTFCIPEAAVVDSPRPERILLMLALTLMESFGVQVSLCLDPAYAPLEGFVLDRTRRRAIVANWLQAEALWHVDITTHRPTLHTYADAIDNGYSRSAATGATSADRLRAFAEFLELDWQWLARRCSELAAYGTAGLLEPRSRLLSVAGVDRACEYLGRLASHAR